MLRNDSGFYPQGARASHPYPVPADGLARVRLFDPLRRAVIGSPTEETVLQEE